MSTDAHLHCKIQPTEITTNELTLSRGVAEKWLLAESAGCTPLRVFIQAATEFILFSVLISLLVIGLKQVVVLYTCIVRIQRARRAGEIRWMAVGSRTPEKSFGLEFSSFWCFGRHPRSALCRFIDGQHIPCRAHCRLESRYWHCCGVGDATIQ